MCHYVSCSSGAFKRAQTHDTPTLPSVLHAKWYMQSHYGTMHSTQVIIIFYVCVFICLAFDLELYYKTQ
jgi:hypothetical protein